MTILAIDPGNVESGYVIVAADDQGISKILEHGKIKNGDLLYRIKEIILTAPYPIYFPIEMIAHYGQGMAAGATTFETCVWIGRFMQHIMHTGTARDQIHFIYRREEKVNLCGSMKAKDKDIKQALVDRFAPGQPNYGKGTKANPGFFYGMSKDEWQAFAVAVTFHDKHIRGIES